MNMFSRNRDGHSDYNALGESLMSDPQADDGQEGVGVTIASQGFGNTTETRPRSSRPQSAISDGIGRLGRGFRNLLTPAAAAAAGSGDGQRTTSAGTGASAYNPSVTRNSAPPNNVQMPAEKDILESCRETVAAGRVASELLRDTTQQAQENPLEAAVLGDTLNQLSRVCMDNQNTLTMMLSSEVLLSDEVLLMETLEVNESLSLALEHYLAFATVPPQQEAQAQQPVRHAQLLDIASDSPPVDSETRVSDSLGEQATEPEGETEEEMIARAIAESLKSEEEYKTRGLVEAAGGLAQPPPPPPPHAPPPSTANDSLLHGLDDLLAPPPSSDPVPTPPQAASPPPAPMNLLD